MASMVLKTRLRKRRLGGEVINRKGQKTRDALLHRSLFEMGLFVPKGDRGKIKVLIHGEENERT